MDVLGAMHSLYEMHQNSNNWKVLLVLCFVISAVFPLMFIMFYSNLHLIADGPDFSTFPHCHHFSNLMFEL